MDDGTRFTVEKIYPRVGLEKSILDMVMSKYLVKAVWVHLVFSLFLLQMGTTFMICETKQLTSFKISHPSCREAKKEKKKKERKKTELLSLKVCLLTLSPVEEVFSLLITHGWAFFFPTAGFCCHYFLAWP